MGNQKIKKNQRRSVELRSKNENNKIKYVDPKNRTQFAKECWNEFARSRYQKEPYSTKIVMVGDQETGKTLILRQFVNNKPLFYFIVFGQGRFSIDLTPYIRTATAILLVFDITNRSSFENLDSRLTILRRHLSEFSPILLVGNKIDLAGKRVISVEEALKYAKKSGLSYIEVSAKEGTNIELLFKTCFALQFDIWRKKNYPALKWMDLAPSLLDIFEINSFNEDFAIFYKNQEFSDYIIKGNKCHRLIVEARLGNTMKDVEIVLNGYSKESVNIFFEWVYGDKVAYSNSELIQEICIKLGIQNYEKKNFVQDITALYKSGESKNFSVFVKDSKCRKDEDEDEDEDEEGGLIGEEEPGEEIPIHKIILLVRSGLFRSMFRNIQENLSTVTDHSARSIDTVKCILKFLYTDEIEMTADYDREIVLKELKDVVEFYQLNKRSTLLKFLEEN
ncbi:ras-related protein rab-37 [Anaeramoeba flamelloides]|uniref:Ras-related protein rab-37 n=1 Tax=Anaeramoeba flamelloides TaxID=1746091 RepID=A0ABQ8Y1D9_9EUKA|nr:ras-related protein rab-37 [Anaeramoeba flamelloides]